MTNSVEAATNHKRTARITKNPGTKANSARDLTAVQIVRVWEVKSDNREGARTVEITKLEDLPGLDGEKLMMI